MIALSSFRFTYPWVILVARCIRWPHRCISYCGWCTCSCFVVGTVYFKRVWIVCGGDLIFFFFLIILIHQCLACKLCRNYDLLFLFTQRKLNFPLNKWSSIHEFPVNVTNSTRKNWYNGGLYLQWFTVHRFSWTCGGDMECVSSCVWMCISSGSICFRKKQQPLSPGSCWRIMAGING